MSPTDGGQLWEVRMTIRQRINARANRITRAGGLVYEVKNIDDRDELEGERIFEREEAGIRINARECIGQFTLESAGGSV